MTISLKISVYSTQ